MILDQEQQLLQKTVNEFAEKEIDPVSQRIEKEGISQDLIKKAAQAGFLGASIPQEYGGSGLDEKGYMILLRGLAGHSASLAFYIFMHDSILRSVFAIKGAEEKAKKTLPAIAAGDMSAGVAFEDLFKNIGKTGLSIDGSSKATGSKSFVFNPHGNFMLVVAKSGQEDWLLSVDNGYSISSKVRKLGLRAVDFSAVSFDSKISDSDVILKSGGLEALQNIYDMAGFHAAAIALGIAGSALSKAVSYSKMRKAFESTLLEFQPLAFQLEEKSAELSRLEDALFSLDDFKDKKKAIDYKIAALDFARSASKLSLQIHGGYGYLEDFQIERYYRDSMMLTALTSNYIKDRIKTSNLGFDAPNAKY